MEKEKLLHIALNRLSAEYPSGLYDWLFKYQQGTYNNIIRLEDDLNASFLNNETVQEFKATLRNYWITHMRAIRDFKESSFPSSSLNEIRAERIEKLETFHPRA